MARPRRAEPPQTNGLIASAIRLPKVTQGRVSNGEGWQDAAWAFYDACPELRFVANWVGAGLSRTELYVTHERGRSDKTVTKGDAVDALEGYFGGQHGQSEMLRQTGIHLTVAGECYHYYRADLDEWRVLAVGKVKQQGTGRNARIVAEWDGEKHQIGPSDVIIRVWNPHPLDPNLADSPTRANLGVLAEIESCTKHIRTSLISRLAGNGILFVPQDITFPIPEDMDPAASSADVFMQVLGEAMMTPIGDPDSAAALVPIVVQAPGDALSQIRHVTFWSDLSDAVREMREAAVKRFALGMDIPPEVLLGTSEQNHWNAWLMDESSVKVHIEPRLAIVTNAITTAYLQPAITDLVPDLAKWSVTADTSTLRLRPNRSREAIELWDRGTLNEEALRRETGFEEEDKPQRNEMAEWLLRKIALGSTTPDQVQAAAEALGAVLPIAAPVDEPTKERDPATDNIRSLEDHPTRTVAPIDGEMPEGMLAAADVLIYRALERAGNRIKSAQSYTGKTASMDIYREVTVDASRVPGLLADAFSCADRVGCGDLEEPLTAYAAHLLITGTEHNRDYMGRWLAMNRTAV